MRAFVTILLACSASPAAAQQCTPPPHPYFDFQVERPAEFIADTTVAARPAITPAEIGESPRLVVQFVVDTLGVPDTTTFKVLISTDLSLQGASRGVFARWRYRPALFNGCRVPQLVQTAVRPRR